ncbi:ABC transporter ATP-binding protein uup [Caedimonas varicaedens]|uniref:ATP-binding protein Uup n=1 Tax=Caedimonas varicaedens TaxID=1629334 RepID=A0A0K8MFQ5_9PROT|nr:ABC transporter ATP-binding protein uup [Caedimonas varicaedens]
MAPPLITLKDVMLTFGGRSLFENLNLSIGEKERVCLVGRNGSGKSTLLKVLAGTCEMDRGERVMKRGSHIAYLPQDPEMPPDTTIEHYVADGLPQDQYHDRFRVAMVLDDMQLERERLIGTLSGGEKRKTALARAFVGEPDLLLLDEPTNHLDLPAIEWLEQKLKDFKGGFIAISHDRMFLTHLSQSTLWLDRGQIRRLDKGFEAFEEWADGLLAQEEVETRKLDKLISEEIRWSRQGISARRKRNQGRLRRLSSFRQHRSEQLKQPGIVRGLEAQTGETSSRVVIEARHISKSFGERLVVDDFSIRLLRGDRVGIIGPNGIGKTTLLKLLMGEMAIDSGKIRWGLNLTPTYLDQNRVILDPDRTLWETLCDTGTDQIMVRGEPRHVVGYLRDFLFEERQVRSPVRVLSGGEKNRLVLAKMLARESNFLILDEPTNDLDMETLDLLQEVLDDYEGTILLISHDRSFLDRIVTSTLVFEEKGKIVEYAGGYSDYRRQSPLLFLKEPKNLVPSSKTVSKHPKKMSQRLSYHQQRLLEVLPQEIAMLEEEKIHIEKTLSDQELFAKSPQQFEGLTRRHDQIINELNIKENQWLELAELKENLKDPG